MRVIGQLRVKKVTGRDASPTPIIKFQYLSHTSEWREAQRVPCLAQEALITQKPGIEPKKKLEPDFSTRKIERFQKIPIPWKVSGNSRG